MFDLSIRLSLGVERPLAVEEGLDPWLEVEEEVEVQLMLSLSFSLSLGVLDRPDAGCEGDDKKILEILEVALDFSIRLSLAVEGLEGNEVLKVLELLEEV